MQGWGGGWGLDSERWSLAILTKRWEDGLVKFLVCNVPNHRSWFNAADIQARKAVLTSVGFAPAPETAGEAVERDQPLWFTWDCLSYCPEGPVYQESLPSWAGAELAASAIKDSWASRNRVSSLQQPGPGHSQQPHSAPDCKQLHARPLKWGLILHGQPR